MRSCKSHAYRIVLRASRSEHARRMSGLQIMHRTSCKTIGAGFKAIGDTFNKLQNHRARLAAVGPTLKPSDGFKTVHALRRSLTYIIYTHMLKPTYMYKIGVTLCGWIEVPAMYRTVYKSPLAGTLSKFKPQTQITVSKRLNYAITSPRKVLETY